MASLKPYLIRAIYEWIVDNDFTPFLLVDAESDDTELPRQCVQNGKIVLNIRPTAVQDLDLGNERITFDARFSGVSYQVDFPVPAVLAIYAKENGKGMIFDEKDADIGSSQKRETPKVKRAKPVLKVVK